MKEKEKCDTENCSECSDLDCPVYKVLFSEEGLNVSKDKTT